MSTLEVELKFPIADVGAVETSLDGIGIQWQPEVAQVDRYWRHPIRDFTETDEALRVRSVGDWAGITYKGPKIDRLTKTRKEIEIPLAAGADAARLCEILEILGFVPAGVVQKRRRPGWVSWDGRSVEVALDQVEGLGDFVELELIVDPNELEPARDTILGLAAHLNLANPERRGYLQMALDRVPGTEASRAD